MTRAEILSKQIDVNKKIMVVGNAFAVITGITWTYTHGEALLLGTVFMLVNMLGLLLLNIEKRLELNKIA